jgi:hypothetical protein
LLPVDRLMSQHTPSLIQAGFYPKTAFDEHSERWPCHSMESCSDRNPLTDSSDHLRSLFRRRSSGVSSRSISR